MRRSCEEHIHQGALQLPRVAEQILRRLIPPPGFAVLSLLQHAIPGYLSEYGVSKGWICQYKTIVFRLLESSDHGEIWLVGL